MIRVQVKLFSLLRKKYGGADYDSSKGIQVTAPQPLTIDELCDMIQVKTEDAACVFINGKMVKDRSVMIQDGDVVGLHFHLPLGG